MIGQEKQKKILLDKFINKNLTKEERHELEKLALDDPFLFEAIQGFTEVEGHHQERLYSLKSRLKSIDKKRRKSLIPYGIAASILLLVSLSVWSLQSKSKSGSSIAANEVEQEINDDSEMQIDNKRIEQGNVGKKIIKDTKDKARTVQNPKKQENKIDELVAEVKTQASSNVPPAIIPVKEATQSKKLKVEKQNSSIQENDMQLAEIQQEEVLEEGLESDKMLDETVTEEATMDTENKEPPASSSWGKNYFVDGVPIQNQFDNYLKTELKDQFSKREIRNLTKDLNVIISISNSNISNYSFSKSLDADIQNRLIEIINSGIRYLPSDVDIYNIDFTSL